MMNQRDSVVCVTAAGTVAGYGIVCSIRKNWGRAVKIVAVDTNPPHLVAAAGKADLFRQTPPVSSLAFKGALLDILDESRASLYIPILDEEILLAAEYCEAGLLDRSVRVLAPPAWSARVCLDKAKAAEWLSEHAIPAPETKSIELTTWRGIPLIAKPRTGRGSKGVKFINSLQDLSALERESKDYIVQERCREPEVTIDSFRSRDGQVFRTICRERIETKAGVCTKARVYEDEHLSSLAKHILNGLQLSTTACIQVMLSPSGTSWVVTDINPRPGAGTMMTTAAGVDLIGAMIADWLDLPLPDITRCLVGELFVVRSFVEHVSTGSHNYRV